MQRPGKAGATRGRALPALRGLAWTLAPVARHALSPRAAGPSTPWSTAVDDPTRGAVRLTGRLHGGEGGPLVVLVHGLGGHMDSPYMIEASRALSSLGLPHLRLNLRGADRSGEDFYHAGLVDDLDAALASPEVAGKKAALWGFSLGGHVSLLHAALRPGATAAVAAVCPPLDLEAGARAIDAWHRRPLLRYMLAGLVDIYEKAAARAPGPVSIERARNIRSIRTWDDEIIAPRFGFKDASDYYARVGVGAKLGQIEAPTLIVSGDADPVLPLPTIEPSLRRAPASVEARVVPGGHVGFARDLDLGERGPRGLPSQVALWLARRGVSRP